MPLRKEVAGPSPRTPPFPDLPPHAGVPIANPSLQHLDLLPSMAEDLHAIRTQAGCANEANAGSQDQWMTYKKAGELLDVSPKTVCDYVKQGKLQGNGKERKAAPVSKVSVVNLLGERKGKTLRERGQAVASADHAAEGPAADANPARPTLEQKAETLTLAQEVHKKRLEHNRKS
jgi:hypothetical protein